MLLESRSVVIGCCSVVVGSRLAAIRSKLKISSEQTADPFESYFGPLIASLILLLALKSCEH